MKKLSVLLILLIVLVYNSGGAYARTYDCGVLGNYYYATVTAEDGLVAEDGTRFEKDEIVVVSWDCLMDDGRIYVCIVKDEEDHHVYVTGREQLAGIEPDPETGLGEYAPFNTDGFDELGHTPYDPEANYVAINDTYLTTGPGRLYEIVCTIPKGTKVKELPNGFNEYYRLEDQYGNKGWAVVWGPGNFAYTTNIDGYYIEDTTLESEDDESEIVVKAGEKLHFESGYMGAGPCDYRLERNGRVYSAPQENLMILEKDDKEVCYMEDCTLLDENLNECDMVIKAGEKVHFVARCNLLVSSDYDSPLIHLEYNGQSFYTNNENYMEIHDEGIEACCMEDTVLLDADLKKTDIVVSAGETVYVDAEWGELLHFDYKGQSFYSYRNSFLIYDDGERVDVYENETLYKDPFLKEPSEIQLETGWAYRRINCGDVTCFVVDDERYYINNKEKTTGVRGAEAFDQAMAKVARYATPTEAESTEAPTMAPTEAPTMAPTAGPTEAPTVLPTVSSTPDLVLTDIYDKKEKEKNNIYIGIGAAAIAVVVAIIGIILLCRGKEDNNGQE